MDLTPGQIALLRDIRVNGAMDALLFSKHRAAGPGMRAMGLLDGIGDSTTISERGMALLLAADAKLRRTA